MRWFLFLVSMGLLPLGAAELTVKGIPGKEWKRIEAGMAGRLGAILERPAAPWRADDAAFLVLRELQSEGYHDAKVTWEIPSGSDRIILQVKEARLLKLGTVEVKGVEDPEKIKEVKGLLSLPVRERGSNVRYTPFVEEKFLEGERLVEKYYHSLGFWDAEASTTQVGTNREKGSVDLLLTVRKGKIHRIADPVFLGVNADVASKLRNQTTDSVGKQASAGNLNAMRARVESWYAKRGFHFAEIQMTAEPVSGSRLQTTFRINPGRQYQTGTIRLHGFEKTKRSEVADFYKDLEGERYAPAAFDEIDKVLLRTGAFKNIRRDLDTGEDGVADVEITFTEGKARGVTFTAGAGAFEGFIVGMGYYDRNFLGRLLTQAYQFEYSGRGLLGEARFTDPLFLDTKTSLNTRLFAITRNQEGYFVARGGVEGFVERRFGDHTTLRLGVAGARVTVQEDGIPLPFLGATDYTDTRVFMRIAYDTRDDPLAPKDGLFLAANLQAGSILDGDTVPYTRGQFQAAYYRTITKNTFVIRASGGVIESDGVMPIDERFFLGGADTVRAFQERELGPYAASGFDPIGGSQYWHASAEYLRTVAGPLRLVSFFDVGSLGTGSDGPGGGEVEMAVGAGIRLNLPIGPIRFEYGYNLTRDYPEPSGAFHFAIGVNF